MKKEKPVNMLTALLAALYVAEMATALALVLARQHPTAAALNVAAAGAAWATHSWQAPIGGDLRG